MHNKGPFLILLGAGCRFLGPQQHYIVIICFYPTLNFWALFKLFRIFECQLTLYFYTISCFENIHWALELKYSIATSFIYIETMNHYNYLSSYSVLCIFPLYSMILILYPVKLPKGVVLFFTFKLQYLK